MLVAFREVPFTAPGALLLRTYDLASSKPRKENADPDWTASVLAVRVDGETWIVDPVRWRDTPARTHALVWEQWLSDVDRIGRSVPVRIEREGGSGGGFTANAFTVDMRRRWTAWHREHPDTVVAPPDVQTVPPGRASKPDRARTVAVLAQRGLVHVVDGPNVEAFLDELEAFPDPKVHDDWVDATSMAFRLLAAGRTIAPPSTVEKSEPDLRERLARPAGPVRRRAGTVKLTN